jgi:hypothetical protein
MTDQDIVNITPDDHDMEGEIQEGEEDEEVQGGLCPNI